MEYCPVLVELTDEIKPYYPEGIKYLLQVWDSNSQKVYELMLQKEVEMWNIFFEFFTFKVQEPDEGHEYYHIVNLAQKNAEILVTEFTKVDRKRKDDIYKYIGYYNNVFYVGSEDQIKILYVDSDRFPDSNQDDPFIVKPDPSEVSTIVMDRTMEGMTMKNIKIHGFFINNEMAGRSDQDQNKERPSCILVALENYQNQIDFNVLLLLTRPGDENFNYQFRQQRPVMTSDSPNYDPITKFQLVFNIQGVSNGGAVRQSGAIDFYHDGMQCLSKNPKYDKEFKGNNVEVSFDETFIHTTYIGEKSDIQDGAAIRGVTHDLRYTQSISQSRVLQNYNIENVFYQRIKQHCNLFTGFVFLKTFIFVAHGNILSFYDILKEKYVRHEVFEDRIYQVFRSLSKDHSDTEKLERHQFSVCVLLDNGQLEFLTRRSGANGEDEYEKDENLRQDVYGEILQFDQDRDDNAWTLMLVKRDDKYALKCIHDCKLITITDLFTLDTDKREGIKITEKTNFVFLYSPKETTEILVHNGNVFLIYELHYDHTADENSQISLVPCESRLNEWIDKSIPSKDQVTEPFVGEEDDLHAAIRVDDYGTMLFADHTYFYVINVLSKEIPPVRFKQMCSGMFLSDGNYIYTLSHKNPDTGTKSGFRLYDIRNCISQVKSWSQTVKKDASIEDEEVNPSQRELMSYLLQSMQVGCQSLIDFSHQNQRFVFQSSYDKILVLPVLHRNSISFIGISEREDYLATKVIDDKFVALSKNNTLTTWCITNGKLIQEVKIDKNIQDFSKWEIYSYNQDKNIAYKQEWAQQVLLVSTEDLGKPVIDNMFYDNKMVYSRVDYQDTYILQVPKTLRRFKLIELTEDKVIEHFQYEFPFYRGVEQHMYFSANHKHMFERLANGRCFIYARGEPDKWTNSVIWNQLHRFHQFPIDLLNPTQYPYIFSPDFSSYLDIDRQENKFLIKDTFTQKTLKTLPLYVMKCDQESDVAVASRFTWLDNNTIKYANREGIERTIDVSNDEFTEVEFNVVPLFSQVQKNLMSEEKHIYFEKLQLPITDTLTRLQLKYQNYKSAYYLGKCSGGNVNAQVDAYKRKKMYRSQFSVDYAFEDYSGRYVTDFSFSYLHWNLMEKLETGQIKVSEIDLEQFTKLIYNILPGGDTVLHRLARKKRGKEIQDILNICHPNPDNLDIPPCSIHIPFLENFLYQETPISILLNQNDFRAVNNMLLYLAAYGIDHHSRAIAKSLPLCVPGPNATGGSKGCQNLVIYLLSRLQQTEECKKNQDLIKGNLDDGRDLPGVIASKFLMSDEHSQVLLQKPQEVEINDLDELPPPQSDLKFQFFDVAQMHEFNNELAQNFFDELKQTDNMSIFDNKGIQSLIKFRWQLVSKYVKQKTFYPFMAFLASFSFYMSTIYELRSDADPTNQMINLVFMGILGAQSFYFLAREFQQIIRKGLSYFADLWNYFDLIPPVILMIFLPLGFVGFFDTVDGVKQNQTLEASLQATCSLLMWLKLLYFLRIYESTGYLIRIIVSVCVDMRYFLFILFLTIMAFGDALRAISTSNLPQNQFIVYWWQSFAYVYRMILGDFSVDPTVLPGGPVVQDSYSDPNTGLGLIAPYFTMGLFYMSTVLNMIIMLNLLIAIISDSFSRINQERNQTFYLDLSDMIAENSYLVPESAQIQFCNKNRFLLIGVDLQQEMNDQPKDNISLLKDTQTKVSEANSQMEQRLIEQIEFQQAENARIITEKFDELWEENRKILEELKFTFDPRAQQE